MKVTPGEHTICKAHVVRMEESNGKKEQQRVQSVV